MSIKRAAAVAMAKNGVNQIELCKRLGLKQPTVSRQLNKEHPSLAFIEMMANEFGMRLSEFFALGED